MSSPDEVYVHCDVLESIPQLNRENWLREIEILRAELPQNARVLQVGSMDGTRVIRLLEARPDLKISGLEIEAPLVEIARRRIAEAGLCADFIHGDITDPPLLSRFDFVICLNNTLGYIPREMDAIAGMKNLGENVVLSVYGEKFDDDLARAYFKSIHLEIDRIENGMIIFRDFTTVRRFSRAEVEAWGGKTIETPIGYFACFRSGRTQS